MSCLFFCCGGLSHGEQEEADSLPPSIWLESYSTHRKIVLLGTGDTGKTTFLHHVLSLYEPALEERFMPVYRDTICNYVKYATNEVLRVMLSHPSMYPLSDRHKAIVDELMAKEREEEEAIKALKANNNPFESDVILFPEERQKKEIRIFACMRKLFEECDSFRQLVVSNDSKKQYLPNGNNIEYFYEKLKTFLKNSNLNAEFPFSHVTYEDLKRVRIKSTGIDEHIFCQGSMDEEFSMIDVGGTRSERQKWQYCLPVAKIVLYFVSLSEFEQPCIEDESCDRLQESLKVWTHFISQGWLEQKTVHLIFTKADLNPIKSNLKSNFNSKSEKLKEETGNSCQENNHKKTQKYSAPNIMAMYLSKIPSHIHTHMEGSKSPSRMNLNSNLKNLKNLNESNTTKEKEDSIPMQSSEEGMEKAVMVHIVSLFNDRHVRSILNEISYTHTTCPRESTD